MDVSDKFSHCVQTNNHENTIVSNQDSRLQSLGSQDVSSHHEKDFSSESLKSRESVRVDERVHRKSNADDDRISEDAAMEISDFEMVKRNAVSQLMDQTMQAIQTEKKSGDNWPADTASNSSTECIDEDINELLTESHKMPNINSHSYSKYKKSSESMSANCSYSCKQQKESDISSCCDLTSTDSLSQPQGDKTDVRDLPEVNLQIDVSSREDGNKNIEMSCTPVILNVRGNATDIDCLTESSTTIDHPTVATVSSDPFIVNKNVRNVDPPYILPRENNQTNLHLPVTNNGVSMPKNSVDTSQSSNLTPAVSSTVSLNNSLQVSTFNKASNVIDTMPATSLLLSVVSCVAKSTESVPIGMSTQPLKTCAASFKTSTFITNVITSTSKTSCMTSSTKELESNVMKKTPISSTVKIVVKESNNVAAKKVPNRSKFITTSSSKHNKIDGIDIELLSNSIVSKIFTNYEMRENEGMTRTEVFNTDLLNPDKKQREYPDRQFVCSVCGDEFYLEEFLNDHFDRKSFVLTYNCLDCKSKITFFNKCRFWLHLMGERREKFLLEAIKRETSYFRLKPFFDTAELEKEIPCVQIFKCNFCTKDFLTHEERVLHLKRTSPYLFTCNKCSMLLANRCALLAHIALHKADDKDHICPQCGERIDHSTGLKALFEHLDSCFHFNTGYVMPCDCGKVFSTTAAFKFHFLKSHTKLLYRCQICASCFTSADFLALHCKRSHQVPPKPNKIVLCTICKQGFQNYWKLKDHVENHADKIVGVRKKVFMCFLCQSYFYDSKSLTSHVEKEHMHRPKRCTICFGLFQSRQNLVQHIVSKKCSANKLPDKLNVCLDKQSDSKTVDVQTYKQMFKITKSILSPKGDSSATSFTKDSTAKAVTAQCEVAQRPTMPFAKPVSGALSQNASTVTTTHNSVSESRQCPQTAPTKIVPRFRAIAPMPSKRAATGNIIGPENDKQKFQCHICKICLVGSNLYKKHMLHHKPSGTSTQNTLCGVCNVEVNGNQIQSHMENHQKQGVIVCSLCQRTNFKTMKEALNHSRNLCNYPVVTAEILTINKSQGTNKKAEHSALTKEKESASESELQSLNTASIQEEATVFPCLMCGLAFTSKQEKEDHASRFHDGTRTLFFCLVCKRKGVKKCFTKNNLLSKHISRKHRIVNPSEIAKSIHKEEQNVASGRVVPTELNNRCNGDAPPPKRLRLADEGEFMCGKCGFSSEDPKLFEDHIITHNPKSEPQCPECGLCFTVITALKKHLFVVHKIKALDEYLEKKGMLGVEEEEPEEDHFESNNGPDFTFKASQSEVEAPKAKRTRTSMKKLIDFECTVCYRLLASEAALQKHMRNHGMAFIRSKRHDKN